jgi:hypothetical protein
MSACPNWPYLVRDRDQQTDGATEGRWDAALAHLEDCPACRTAALDADPLLAFRRLSTVELSPASEQAEIEETRRVVAALRTGQRLTAESGRTGRLRAAGRVAHLRDWGVAAVLALATFALGTGHTTPPTVPVAAAPSAGAGFAAVPVRTTYQPGVTSVEGLNRPNARVYQLRGDHLSVVMIVDEKLNV